MSGYEFDPKDKDGSLRDRFDCYCKEVIGRAAHNLVFKQAQYLILHFGGGEIDPSMMMHEDEHDNLYAVKMTVRGKDVFIGHERLAKLLPKLQKRKREILLMYYLLDMTLEEIANELGVEYETVKSTKSKAIKELRKKMDQEKLKDLISAEIESGTDKGRFLARMLGYCKLMTDGK